MLYTMRALKRISFRKGQNIQFVEPGDYFEVEEEQMKKFVKLQAAEVVSEEVEEEGEEITDIGQLIEKLEGIRTKKQLIELGEKLGVEGLDEEMHVPELRTAIVNAVEEREDEDENL